MLSPIFLLQRKQRVILNGQHSSWTNIEARVPQGSTLEPLFFLIYINNLSDGLASNPKLFADNTSLFSVIHNIKSTANNLNSDLMKVSNWAFQQKMRFNPDPNKQAQEVIFSRKINKSDHPPLYFNQNLVKSSSTHKHLRMVLDTRLDFNLHLRNIQNKVNKTIGLLHKLQNALPRTSLITVFKSFLQPLYDYGDIIYDRAYNTLFHQNVESIQYNAALAITSAVRGTSREKLYQELGFEFLQQRYCYRELCCLFKIINNQLPRYLFQLVPSPNTRYFPQNSENIPQLWTKYDFFKNSFFPSTIKEWNNLDLQIRKSKSISIFKSNILKFIRPKSNNVYFFHKPRGIKLLTRLRLGLSYLREHKFKHNFQDYLNPLRLCGNEIENSTHYLLHCPTYTNERLTLLNKIKSINCSILESSDAAVTKILLFGDNTLSNSSNTIIFNSTIEYIISTQRFEGSILTPI